MMRDGYMESEPYRDTRDEFCVKEFISGIFVV